MIDVELKIYKNLSYDSLSFKKDEYEEYFFTCHVHNFGDILRKAMADNHSALVTYKCYVPNTDNLIDESKLMCNLTEDNVLTYMEVTNDVYKYFI